MLHVSGPRTRPHTSPPLTIITLWRNNKDLTRGIPPLRHGYTTRRGGRNGGREGVVSEWSETDFIDFSMKLLYVTVRLRERSKSCPDETVIFTTIHYTQTLEFLALFLQFSNFWLLTVNFHFQVSQIQRKIPDNFHRDLPEREVIPKMKYPR